MLPSPRYHIKNNSKCVSWCIGHEFSWHVGVVLSDVSVTCDQYVCWDRIGYHTQISPFYMRQEPLIAFCEPGMTFFYKIYDCVSSSFLFLIIVFGIYSTNSKERCCLLIFFLLWEAPATQSHENRKIKLFTANRTHG